MIDIFSLIKTLKKHITFQDILIIILLLSFFLLTRLINLTSLPIFGDEGIYIRWAKTAWKDANWRFISLTDGRQPLQTWLTIPFLKLFPNNPLFAGRLFGVLSGFLSLSGIFLLTFLLFGKKTAYIASLLYIFTPMSIFYDRMALVDSMVNAGFLWIFFLSIFLFKTLRLDLALIFGLASGFFLLAKSSMRLALINSLFAFLISLKEKPKASKLYNLFRHTLNYYFLLFIGFALAFIIYNIQRLSPFFHFVAKKNLTFVLSFEEFKQNPFSLFPKNIKLIPIYLFSETTWSFGIISLLGLYLLFKKNKGLFFYLLSWIVLPILAIAFFAKVLFPRYLLFLAGLLVIPASYFLSQLSLKSLKKQTKRQIITLSLALLFVFQALFFDKAILFSPKDTPFPPVDRGQYIEGITAGWGLKEIMSFAREKAREKPVILVVEGDFGVAGDQLETLKKPSDTKISIKGYWPLDEKILLKHQKDLNNSYVFVVFSHNQNPPENWPIKLIRKYPKPNSNKAILLYELKGD